MATIKDLLRNELIVEELSATDKEGVLREFARLMAGAAGSRNEDEIVRTLHERESLGSTGIGGGIAIPHGKLKNLTEMIVAFGRSSRGVEYEAMDGKPVHLFFVLLTPDDRPGDHLKTLARISRILKNPALREALQNSPDRGEIRRLLFEEDAKYPQPGPHR